MQTLNAGALLRVSDAVSPLRRCALSPRNIPTWTGPGPEVRQAVGRNPAWNPQALAPHLIQAALPSTQAESQNRHGVLSSRSKGPAPPAVSPVI